MIRRLRVRRRLTVQHESYFIEEANDEKIRRPCHTDRPVRAAGHRARGGAGIEWQILNQEVMALERAGQYDRAVGVAQKALQVAEQNVGPSHPDVAMSLNNLAALYRTQGAYAKAEPLYKRALAIREQAFGPATSRCGGEPHDCAALLYSVTGRHAEAKSLERREEAIRTMHW
jgi:tetratricopeptide (TPR) repeat protein